MKLTTRKGLQIGQLAKLAGVRPDTVRFYERDGLLVRPERSPAGYRIYDEAAVKRLRFVKQAQALGFSLDEIRRILSLRGRGKETCRCVIEMAEASLVETEEKLKELQKFRDALKANLMRWQRSADQGGRMVAEFCALIESIQEGPNNK
jgi:MerR family Zn(II)-responsive transcriptional regulator of zntA